MASLVDVLIGPITGLLDKIIPDKDQRERLAHDIAVLAATQAHASQIAQIDVNKEEAAHPSLFVAGWRPSVGWICSTALGWNFVLYPIMQWVAFLYGIELEGMPELDNGELMTVLLGMLGLGTLRTYEKTNRIADSRIGKDQVRMDR